MNLQKKYMFNPFNIVKADMDSITTTYMELTKNLIDDPNTLYEYANNIECLANINYILGEMLARNKKKLVSAKNDLKIKEAEALIQARKQYMIDNPNEKKLPSVSHFQAIALSQVKKEYIDLADIEGDLARFKNAFETNEQLQNALKKKLDAIKWEEFSQRS